MGAADHKFTDWHVRNHPVLEQLAVDYARGYTGDYEFLVKAHIWVTENGTLSVPVIRGVLNCMRMDLSVAADLPDPSKLWLGEPEPPQPPRQRAHLKPVPEYKPPVPLNVTFHYGYLVSTKPLFPSHPVRICHILNHGRSGAKVEHGRVVTYLKAWCGWNVNDWRDELQAQTVPSQPEGSRACRSCNKLLLKAGME